MLPFTLLEFAALLLHLPEHVHETSCFSSVLR